MDIIVLRPSATEDELRRIVKKLEGRGLRANISKGTERTVIGVIGDTSKIAEEEENAIRVMPGVEDVMRILKPFKLASREFRAEDTTINVKGNIIGGKKTGRPVGTEVMDPRDMEVIAKYADIIQIGARNMQNFRLLLEVGTSRKPVLLKRGLSATIKEWLMAAEYIMSRGNQNVILS